jgi:hypothetical protein
MKLTATAQVSVDGVMQAPGGPEEDEQGRFGVPIAAEQFPSLVGQLPRQ